MIETGRPRHRASATTSAVPPYPRWLAVPDGEQPVGPVEHGLAVVHVGLLGRLDSAEAVDLLLEPVSTEHAENDGNGTSRQPRCVTALTRSNAQIRLDMYLSWLQFSASMTAPEPADLRGKLVLSVLAAMGADTGFLRRRSRPRARRSYFPNRLFTRAGQAGRAGVADGPVTITPGRCWGARRAFCGRRMPSECGRSS